ncbi:MobV family relaxase [Vibrio cyclitrophicus]
MKTVLRFEKLKSYKNIRLSNAHVQRYINTPNADSKVKNHVLYGSKNVMRDVKRKIKASGLKPRKNSVICMEAVLSLSPEFFEENKNEKIKLFAKQAREFLKERYGKNLVGCYLHLDEKTPHIHAYIVPMTKDGRLSARDTFNKETLKEFQEYYCNKMNEIEGFHFEYKKGSKAEHKDIKEFYTEINNVSEIKKENDLLKEQVKNLEIEVEEKIDENFELKGKIEKIEKLFFDQSEKIEKLSSLVNKLKNKIKKLLGKNEVKKESPVFKPDIPKLEISFENPEEEKELKKKRKIKNRL